MRPSMYFSAFAALAISWLLAVSDHFVCLIAHDSHAIVGQEDTQSIPGGTSNLGMNRVTLEQMVMD